VTTVLDLLVGELRTGTRVSSTGRLAERLGVDESALCGMLRELARKGVVATCDEADDAVGCRTKCLAACPFVVSGPASYAVVADPSGDRRRV